MYSRRFGKAIFEAILEKTKVATKYGMKICHTKNRTRKANLMNSLFLKPTSRFKLNQFALDFYVRHSGLELCPPASAIKQWKAWANC